MKVTLEKEYKKYYTLEDIDRAKEVIRYEKEDEETAKGWAEYAVREALREENDYLDRIIEADARTARNCRAWNLYGETTGDMDTWITATAKTSLGFIEVGAYLSDIWQTGATPYKHHMFIAYYARA